MNHTSSDRGRIFRPSARTQGSPQQTTASWQRGRGRALSIGAISLSVLMLVGHGCRSATEVMFVPLVRLVDLLSANSPETGRVSRGTNLPRATILDETRYVLDAPAHYVFAAQDQQIIDEEGKLSTRLRSQSSLAGAARLVIVPHVRLEGKPWSKRPPILWDGTLDTPRSPVVVTLHEDTATAGTKADVSAEGYDMSWGTRHRLRTPAIEIPHRVRLEFGTGILEPAWRQGAVRFEISICRGDACEPIFSETRDPRTQEGRAWRDHRLSLAGVPRTPVSLLFDARLISDPSQDDDNFSLPVWSNPTLYVPRHRESKDLNIVLLSIDTLSARHLSTHGHKYDTAPFVDQTFAKRGTVFANCISAATTTTPSHMTMFTSLLPSVHGSDGSRRMPLPKGFVMLAELLRSANMDTAAITENGWLGMSFGFARGFDDYSENKSPSMMNPQGQVDRTFEKAKKWLRRSKDKRFFLFLHTFQVHSPYVPPARYAHLFEPSDAEEKVDGYDWGEWNPAAYDREIRYVDDELRSLFDTIRAEGLNKNTVFILTSDHGEEFLEHGRFAHGPQLYEEVAHVPLLFHGPGIPAGRRLTEPVSLLSLMPTILDLASVDVPSQAMGSSLFGFLRDDVSHHEIAPDPIYTEALGGIGLNAKLQRIPFFPPAFAVRIGHRKLHRYRAGKTTFRYEYYDLRDDPAETRNLYARRPVESAELRALLDHYRQVNSSLRKTLLRSSVAAPAHEDRPANIDPEREEKLRALGYID